MTYLYAAKEQNQSSQLPGYLYAVKVISLTTIQSLSYPAESMHDRTDLTALVVYGTLDGFSYKDLDGWVAEVEALCPANKTTFVKYVVVSPLQWQYISELF
jgi:hypothetical protein